MSAFDWIDMVRDPRLFSLFQTASSTGNPERTELGDFLHFPRDNGRRDLFLDINEMYPFESDLGMGLIHMTNPHTVGRTDRPHAPSPAPAQRADNITIVFTQSLEEYSVLGYDEGVGVFAPTNALWDAEDPGSPGCGSFGQRDPHPHRDDGFPAVIVIGGLQKHYHEGKLHRTGNHPALKADYVGAVWMNAGKKHRPTGPSTVLLTDYQEFHSHGEYQGFRFKGKHLTWDHQNDPQTHPDFWDGLSGKTDVLSNQFFTNPQDQMLWMMTQRSLSTNVH